MNSSIQVRHSSWIFDSSNIGPALLLFLLLQTLIGLVFVQWAYAEAKAEEVNSSPDHSQVSSQSIDPWEKMNRGIFWFNEKTDIYFVEPVARGWRFMTPSFFRTAVQNFSDFLLMPVVFGNDLLQLKPKQAVQDVGRVIYNASFGLVGLIDVASMIGIPQNDEDFGQTLGYWGVPSGPYLVLPVFGPATIRGGVGRLGDAAGGFYFTFLPIWATFTVRVVELINLRSRFIEEVDESRREAFDYYVFMRNAYLQNRRAKIDRARGEDVEALEVDDLYYFEGDFEDDLEEVEEDPSFGEDVKPKALPNEKPQRHEKDPAVLN